MITRIKNFIVRNWMAKLFCLLFALSLWAWVKVQQTAEQRFDARVEFRNLPEEFVVTGNSDDVVSVTLSGPKTTLNRIDAESISVEIDASQFQTGGNSVRILPWNLDYPRGLNVESIQPPRVNVEIERRIFQQVTVDPNVSAPPPEGFEYETNVDPETAVLRGSEQVLSEVDEIDLPPVDLSDQTESLQRPDVSADLPEDVLLEYPDTNVFFVEFDIFEPVVERTITGIPVQALQVPEGMRGIVEPTEISLEVRGPYRLVEELEPSDIEATVRAPSGGEPIIRQARVRLLVDGVELAGGQPDQRSVQVRVMESE